MSCIHKKIERNLFMSEIDRLEASLAYSAARSYIECYCRTEHHSGRYYGRWYDTCNIDSCNHDAVSTAVRYLELKNFLKRHPEKVTLVQIISAT